jgi:hypothetical protein
MLLSSLTVIGNTLRLTRREAGDALQGDRPANR